jgi:16S rRNA (cytidine1402-2'-O)-methyltransferase
LTLSGLPTRRFCFEAFLPTDKKEKQRILTELKNETRTIILYEAPHRLLKSLKELNEALGDRRLTIIKELTKKHETVWQTTLAEAASVYGEQEPKGEYVIVLDGRSEEELELEKQDQWGLITVKEHMKLYTDRGVGKKEAMKAVAKDRGVSKREIYQMLIQEEDSTATD